MLGTEPSVVVITGASRGVGAALAEALAEGGDEIITLARAAHPEAADEPGAGRIFSCRCDVSDQASVAAAFEEIAGITSTVDGLVLNAGVSPTRRRAQALEPTAWQQIIDVNLTGAFLAAHHAYALLSNSAAPRVVITSSVMARRPISGLTAYTASKAGLEGLTAALAVDWARDGILVNAVALGFYETDLSLPLRGHGDHGAFVTERSLLSRWGNVRELVGAYELLLSPKTTYTTGAVISVDGGYLLG